MATRVRFASIPTGPLHLGDALTAVANRRFGDRLILRIDDIDPTRNVPGGEEATLRDLEWLGVRWDEGPVRQSERGEAYRAAAARLGGDEVDGVRLVRSDGSATPRLASVVDDAELGITHVIRGADHQPDEALHRRIAEALGVRPPEYVHHGLIVGEAGGKASGRDAVPSLAQLREAGIPREAVRAYLEELGLPGHDVRYDPARLRRLSLETIARLPDEELAARAEAPPELARALRGARDLVEARAFARMILRPQAVAVDAAARPTLERFVELRGGANGSLDAARSKEIVRELKAVGGDLRALRLALTGRDRGPELWTVVAALPRDEALRRAGAAL